MRPEEIDRLLVQSPAELESEIKNIFHRALKERREKWFVSFSEAILLSSGEDFCILRAAALCIIARYDLHK